MTTDATANTYREAAIIKADRSITLKGNLVAANTNPPATATSTGVQGQIAFDSQYVYYCHATDTWVRSPMATW
jgi:hypothetical protein